jgi:hypothetical protein
MQQETRGSSSRNLQCKGPTYPACAGLCPAHPAVHPARPAAYPPRPAICPPRPAACSARPAPLAVYLARPQRPQCQEALGNSHETTVHDNKRPGATTAEVRQELELQKTRP